MTLEFCNCLINLKFFVINLIKLSGCKTIDRINEKYILEKGKVLNYLY